MKIRYSVRVNRSGNFAIGDLTGASLFYRIWENEIVPNHMDESWCSNDGFRRKEKKILNRMRTWGGL